jgi:hypothetical protein
VSVNWTFQATTCTYPAFIDTIPEDGKTLAISEFIRDENGIKVVDAVKE